MDGVEPFARFSTKRLENFVHKNLLSRGPDGAALRRRPLELK